MQLIVDGHNLIPHIPGLSLSDPDDEHKLIKVLQDYSRIRQNKIEVYFDQAAVGQAGQASFGQVKAVYVQRGMTADQAIMNRLKKLGKRARNVLVVSSDRQVQQAARAVHASVMTSDTFSAECQRLMQEEPELDPRSRLLSPDEVEMWERFFQHGHGLANHSSSVWVRALSQPYGSCRELSDGLRVKRKSKFNSTIMFRYSLFFKGSIFYIPRILLPLQEFL